MSESQRDRDRELGMDRKITRRDFLDGVALTVGGAALVGASSGLLTACESAAKPTLQTPRLDDYPPDLTGLQGQTDAARAVPHMLRDGTFWKAAGTPHDTGESYDLAVVGGGISGLAAAYFYARQNPSARILVLDNHDDFGGHARRNEFTPLVNGYGRLLIGYGGTESIDTPSIYSHQAMALLEDIGIEAQRFYKYFDNSFWNASSGIAGQEIFFDEGTWGRDHTILMHGEPTAETLKDAPMAEEAKRDLVMLYHDPKDWMPGLTDAQKKARLSEITYAQFLTDIVKVHPDVVKYLYNWTCDDWGYGIDDVGAIDAWADGYTPGFRGLGLSESKPYKDNSPSEWKFWGAHDPYIFHFPDGGGGVARLLVRALIPDALPGRTMESEVLARLDYDKLDLPENRVRIRLGSPVARVHHLGDPASATEVEVAYVQGGDLKTVRSKGVIMACWYSMIPYIVDGLPEIQQRAARFMTRIPLLYGTVQLRTRRVFQKLGIWGIRPVGPGARWVLVQLDYPVSMGGYEYPTDLEQPGLLHLVATPTRPGMPPRDGVKLGRQDLYKAPFADLERSIRDLLARSLGAGGFDSARDIQAITINRWAHGYTFEYEWPWDKAFYPDGPLPGQVAARPFGRITFAGTDRFARAYVDSAIDAAYAAVNDLQSRM